MTKLLTTRKRCVRHNSAQGARIRRSSAFCVWAEIISRRYPWASQKARRYGETQKERFCDKRERPHLVVATSCFSCIAHRYSLFVSCTGVFYNPLLYTATAVAVADIAYDLATYRRSNIMYHNTLHPPKGGNAVSKYK